MGLESATNQINIGGFVRWTWRTYQRQPVLMAATAISMIGVGVAYFSTDSFNKRREEYQAGLLKYD
eukprot:m.2229 g.2229  ORF g.2229 m.2229 type:complete len:66 (-) comp1739_c0_seq1:202-399(-)